MRPSPFLFLVFFFSLMLSPDALACEFCASSSQVCTSFQQVCTSQHDECDQWDEDGNCTHTTTVCDSTEWQCVSWETVCDSFYYGDTVTVSGKVSSSATGGGLHAIKVVTTAPDGGTSATVTTDASGNYSAQLFVYDDASGNLSFTTCTQTQDGYLNECEAHSVADTCNQPAVTSPFSLDLGPSLPYADDFSTDPAGGLPAQWSAKVGAFSIAGGVARGAGTGVSLAVVKTLAGKDVALESPFDIAGSGTPSFGLVARYSGPGDSNMYVGLISSSGSPVAGIYRVTAGTWTLLGSATAPAATGVLRFEVQGVFQRLFLDGVLLVSTQDTGILRAGAVGIRAGGGDVTISRFRVSPLASNPTGIWNDGILPDWINTGITASGEVGMKFRVDTDGFATGVRFYKAGGNTGTHIGHLWDASGNLLAAVTFTQETASGWQTAMFSTPVVVHAGVTYVVSYHGDHGNFAQSIGYFSAVAPFSGPFSGIGNGSLHALAAGVDGANGLYSAGTGAIFPKPSTNSSNFWVDVLFQIDPPVAPPPMPPPQSLAIQADSTTALTATWLSGGGSTLGFKIAIASGQTAPSCASGIDVGSATSHQFTGLLVNNPYTVQVCAYNAAGNFSAGINATGATLNFPPPAPKSLLLTANSSTQITANWVSGGGTTKGYRIAYAQGTTAPDCATGTDVKGLTSFVMKNLLINTVYTVQVCAYNNNGALSPGISASKATLNPAPPAPKSLTFVADSTTSLVAAWTSGGGTTAGYKLAYAKYGTALNCRTGIDVGPATSRQITGLVPNTVYAVQLCAYNSSAIYSTSVGASQRTQNLVPPTPVSFALTADSTSSLVASWKSGGGTTYGYRVAIARNATPDCSQGVNVSTYTSHRFLALSVDTVYTVAVCAYNNTGQYSPAASGAKSTLNYVPASPRSFTLTTQSSTAINATWISGGGTTLGFKIAYAKYGQAVNCRTGTDVGLATSQLLTGLLPNTAYTVQVCAYNDTQGYSTAVTATKTTLR